ncbi:ArsR family transcriptional regulator [Streptomyces sp. NPDC088194]|uniref:ArsR family transcriptional regulator n=1 Tax=Streptomyces sp. NPDC088194 TaxID=3154931 RepID=UPI00344DA70D
MHIHFTLDDLARTRLAPAPSPLAMTSLSVYRLGHGPPSPGLDLWRRTVRAGLRASTDGGYDPFAELAPTAPSHPVPRFLRPYAGLRTLDEELERLRATPRQSLRADIDYIARHRDLPPRTVRDLADARPHETARLAARVRAYHRVAVAPYREGLAAALAADRAVRSRQLLHGGVESVLRGLHPRMRWRPPVLELDGHGDGDEYRLGGRGLVLAPGAFSTYVPCDPADEQPALYYEVFGGAHPALFTHLARPDNRRTALAALLGHSRAAVLQVAADGASTNQLAARAGLSAASASKHASVLRDAGLLTTHRTGRAVHHTLTPLGAQLLSAP